MLQFGLRIPRSSWRPLLQHSVRRDHTGSDTTESGRLKLGKIGRREAKRTYPNSADRIQLCLSQYDRGELNAEEAAATTISEYGAQIAALERKVGSLAMEIDLLKKTPRLRPE